VRNSCVVAKFTKVKSIREPRAFLNSSMANRHDGLKNSTGECRCSLGSAKKADGLSLVLRVAIIWLCYRGTLISAKVFEKTDSRETVGLPHQLPRGNRFWTPSDCPW
jgi:hypothetical protein